MPCQLPIDCLDQIFKILDDKTALYSCLLVNRLLCEVRIQKTHFMA